MKKHLYKALAAIAATLLIASCAEERTPDGNDGNGKSPLAIGSLAVATTPDANGSKAAGTRTTDAVTGDFGWATNDAVTVVATPTGAGKALGLKTYTATYVYTKTVNAGAWTIANGTGYEGNTPIYREDVDGTGLYTFAVETWGGKTAPTGTADANGTANRVDDQSTAEAYILSDYIHGAALLNAHTGMLYADATESSNNLQHRTVDVVINIRPGNGWTSTDATAGKEAFVAHMKAVAANKGFKIYAGGDYRVDPLLVVNNDATITLRAHLPVASLHQSSNGGANSYLFSLKPQPSEGQTTLTTVFGAYNRPAELADGNRLNVSMTYSQLKGLSDITATLGDWTPVGNLPDFDGGLQTIPGYDVVIRTPEDLATFAAAVNSGANIYSLDKGEEMKASEAKVIQPIDIDLSQLKASTNGKYAATANNWIAIGNEKHPFTGAYNGNGHTIAGMTITNHYQNPYIGFFGLTEASLLTDIQLKDAKIELTTQPYETTIGLLAGKVLNGSVGQCSTSGSINVSCTAATVGGLIGFFEANRQADITLCRTDVVIDGRNTGNTFDNYLFAGGVIGLNNGRLFSCSATGKSITLHGGFVYAGGVAGANQKSLLFACCTTTDINLTGGKAYAVAGGVVGFNAAATLDSNYATGMVAVSGSGDATLFKAGAICGHHQEESVIDNCYGAGRTSTVANGIADTKTNGKGTSNLESTPTIVYADGQTPAAGSIYRIVSSNSSYDNLLKGFNSDGTLREQTSKWYASQAWTIGALPMPNEAYRGTINN